MSWLYPRDNLNFFTNIQFRSLGDGDAQSLDRLRSLGDVKTIEITLGKTTQTFQLGEVLSMYLVILFQ